MSSHAPKSLHFRRIIISCQPQRCKDINGFPKKENAHPRVCIFTLLYLIVIAGILSRGMTVVRAILPQGSAIYAFLRFHIKRIRNSNIQRFGIVRQLQNHINETKGPYALDADGRQHIQSVHRIHSHSDGTLGADPGNGVKGGMQKPLVHQFAGKVF